MAIVHYIVYSPIDGTIIRDGSTSEEFVSLQAHEGEAALVVPVGAQTGTHRIVGSPPSPEPISVVSEVHEAADDMPHLESWKIHKQNHGL